MISFWISVVPPKIGWMGRCWKWQACELLGQPSDDLVGPDERWRRLGLGKLRERSLPKRRSPAAVQHVHDRRQQPPPPPPRQRPALRRPGR
jgi:hypothetical protein